MIISQVKLFQPNKHKTEQTAPEQKTTHLINGGLTRRIKKDPQI